MYPKQQRRPLPSLLYKSNRGSRKLLINSDAVHQTPDHLCLLSGYSRWRPSPRGRFWHLRHPRESAARPSRPWHQKPDSSQQYSRYSFGGIFLIWIGGFFPCNDCGFFCHFLSAMIDEFISIFSLPWSADLLLFFALPWLAEFCYFFAAMISGFLCHILSTMIGWFYLIFSLPWFTDVCHFFSTIICRFFFHFIFFMIGKDFWHFFSTMIGDCLPFSQLWLAIFCHFFSFMFVIFLYHDWQICCYFFSTMIGWIFAIFFYPDWQIFSNFFSSMIGGTFAIFFSTIIGRYFTIFSLIWLVDFFAIFFSSMPGVFFVLQGQPTWAWVSCCRAARWSGWSRPTWARTPCSSTSTSPAIWRWSLCRRAR